MTQDQLLTALAQCKKWKTDLTPMISLAEQFGNPQNQLKFIHVGGTNGKGSTSTMLACILEQAGYKTGRFISPYILNFRERIQVNGEQIPEADLCRLGSEVIEAARKLEEKELYPAEFDLVTMIAFRYFAEQNCDIVILEVGVGGGIDSTNIILPETVEASVLTSISLDHTAILGNSEAEIAGEKCGIFKENIPVIVSASIPNEAMNVIKKQVEMKHCPLSLAEKSSVLLQESRPDGLLVNAREQELFLPLPGLYQLQNLATALTVVDALKERGYTISDEAVRLGIANVRFPARMELLGKNPRFWIDGAHNPEGVASLKETVEYLAPNAHRVCVCGMMADKSCGEVVAVLSSIFDEVITMTVQNPRALQDEELAELWRSHNVPAECGGTDMARAVSRAVELAGNDGVVVCCGSLFLCSEIRPHAIAYFCSSE